MAGLYRNYAVDSAVADWDEAVSVAGLESKVSIEAAAVLESLDEVSMAVLSSKEPDDVVKVDAEEEEALDVLALLVSDALALIFSFSLAICFPMRCI
jgi:hypothetical protein